MNTGVLLPETEYAVGNKLRIVPYTDEYRDDVVRLLNVCLGERPGVIRDGAYWDWKHLQNPFGRSILLLGFVGDQLAGVRALMRWRFCDGRRCIAAVKPVDSATHPDFQRRGIFSQLTVEALHEAEQQGVEFCFNTPNANSLPGYLKLGWRPVAKLQLSICIQRPLRVFGELCARRLSSGANPVRWLSKAVASMPECKKDGFGKPSYSCASSPVPAREVLKADDRLGELLRARSASQLVETQRSVEFLRWRYGGHPHVEYFAETIESQGRLDGVLFYRVGQRQGLVEVMVHDVLVRGQDERLAEQLLRKLRRLVRSDYLVGHAATRSPLRPAYRKAGFRRWPVKHVQLVGRELYSADGHRLPHELQWGLCLGDDLVGF